jgi:hypothetical protein
LHFGKFSLRLHSWHGILYFLKILVRSLEKIRKKSFEI